jgi:hypothetical protein
MSGRVDTLLMLCLKYFHIMTLTFDGRRLIIFFFFQALNFLVESFGLLDLFPLPSILDAGFPVFDLHLADILCDVILPSILGSSL